MTTEVTAKYWAPERAGLLGRLVVRSDLVNGGNFPTTSLAVVCAIVVACYPIVLVTHSLVLAVMMMAVMLAFLAWVVAACFRTLYCVSHPYLSPRWLAAAQATFGDDVMVPVLKKFRAWSPDAVLRRAEMVDAIYARRQHLNRARMAARGVHICDVAGQGWDRSDAVSSRSPPA